MGAGLVRLGGHRFQTTVEGGGGEPPPPTIDKFAQDGGSDSTGTGTELNPYESLDHLIHNLEPGQTGALRGAGGGLFDQVVQTSFNTRLNRSDNPGATEGNPIKIINYPGETASIRGQIYLAWSGIKFESSYPSGNLLFNAYTATTPGNGYTFQVFNDDVFLVNLDICNNNPADMAGFYTEESAIFLGEWQNFMINNFWALRNRIHHIHWINSGNQPHGCYADLCTNSGMKHNIFYEIRASTVDGSCYACQAYPRAQNFVLQNNLVYGCANAFVYGTQTNSVRACTGNTTNGSKQITNFVATGSTIPAQIGKRITGSGIPANTYIRSYSGTTITITQNATATATGVAFNAFESVDGGTCDHNLVSNVENKMIGSLWNDTTSGTPPSEHITIQAHSNHSYLTDVLLSGGNGMNYVAGTSGNPLFANPGSQDFTLGAGTPVPADVGPDTLVRL